MEIEPFRKFTPRCDVCREKHWPHCAAPRTGEVDVESGEQRGATVHEVITTELDILFGRGPGGTSNYAYADGHFRRHLEEKYGVSIRELKDLVDYPDEDARLRSEPAVSVPFVQAPGLGREAGTVTTTTGGEPVVVDMSEPATTPHHPGCPLATPYEVGSGEPYHCTCSEPATTEREPDAWVPILHDLPVWDRTARHRERAANYGDSTAAVYLRSPPPEQQTRAEAPKDGSVEVFTIYRDYAGTRWRINPDDFRNNIKATARAETLAEAQKVVERVAMERLDGSPEEVQATQKALRDVFNRLDRLSTEGGGS